MKEIKLTQDKYALVDDADFEFLNQWKWHYAGEGYAMKHENGTKVYMHRLINQTPKGFDTDHINGNKLDNQRKNLRTATRSLNNINTGLRKTNTSGYKGVYWNELNHNWRVMLNWQKKHFELGSFKNLKEAVLARQKAERMYRAT